MPRITPPYLQYRYRIAEHADWQNKAYPTQQQQDSQIQRLAAQPGRNSDNIDQQRTAQALIQLLSLLTSIQNRRIQPPVFQHSVEACTGSGEAKEAVKMGPALRNHRAERSVAVLPMYTEMALPSESIVGGVNDFLPLPATASAAQPAMSARRADMMHHFHDERITREFFKKIVGLESAEMAVNGTNLSPVIFFFAAEKASVRTKRMNQDAAQQLQETAFRQYLANNCRIRTKSNEGQVLGDSLLVSGEYVRNPLRAVAEEIYGSENNNQPMPPWLVQFYEGGESCL